MLETELRVRPARSRIEPVREGFSQNAAARTLEGITFGAAHTSKLKRAQDTLAEILAELGQTEIEAEQSAALNERDKAASERLAIADIFAKSGNLSGVRDVIAQIDRSECKGPDDLRRLDRYLNASVVFDPIGILYFGAMSPLSS